MADFDSIYKYIGDFGLYQKFVFFLTCVCSFIVAPPVVMSVFTEGVPKHRCQVSSCDSKDSNYEEDFLNFTIPLNQDGDSWSQCEMYSHSYGEGNVTCLEENFNQSASIRCLRWIYDKELFLSTTVTEYELVCDRSWLIPISTSAYMLGMLCGSLTMGFVADRLGRKIGILICVLIFTLGGAGQALAPNYTLFLVLRFITGVGAISMFNVAFVLAIEFVGVGWRTFSGMMIMLPFSLGEASVGVLAYFVKDFRWLIASLSIVSVFLVSYYWIMPESIRWLIAKGRKDEALKIVQKAAKVNGLDIPKTLEITADSKSDNDLEDGKKTSVLALLSQPNIRKRTLILFYCWIVCTLAYYGISLSSKNLSGDIYINFIASMLIEIPGYLFVYFALDRIGRKGTMCLLFFICGAACIISGFLPQSIGWLVVTMSLLGKFGISGAFGGIFVFTAELFPTEYRSLGVGTCSTCARIGGIIAPFIASLSEIYLQLPILVFGGTSLLASLAILTLPETVGAELPQTIEESENFGKGQSLCYFSCCGNKKTPPNS